MATWTHLLKNYAARGITEIHCMLHVEKQDFIKRHPLMCLMLQNMGLIYGIK